MTSTDFTAVSYPWRLFSGAHALDNLSRVVAQCGSRRAFVICGQSVATKTDLLSRIRDIVGERYAGHFGTMRQEAPLDDVQNAVAAAREADADMLIAVGAGTVIKATRVIAILLAENAPPERLMTQYPPSGPAVSPRLLAPKLPIVNVLTAATSAQNRAGAAVKQTELGQRMEFFDPKTRPIAIFWDADALLTAPPRLALNTGVAVYWRALMNMGSIDSVNPLIEGERAQALRLAERSLRRITEHDALPRIEMCAAALLQNREEDEGRSFGNTHWVARVVYALGASAFTLCDTLSQGEAYASLTGASIRYFGERNIDGMVEIGHAIGFTNMQATPEGIASLADAIDNSFRDRGMKLSLRDYGVTRDLLPRLLEFSMRNFNADRDRKFLNERELLLRTLEAAW